MRILTIFGLVLLTASAALAGEAIQNSTNSLNFFVVSDTPLRGGRYVDTPEFPKLGYVSNSPSLVVSALRSVGTNSQTSIERFQGKEKQTVETVLEITMEPADAKKFAKLTGENVGRQVVIMLGQRPLLAPFVMQPIDTPTIAIRVGEKADFQSLERDLRRLAKHE